MEQLNETLGNPYGSYFEHFSRFRNEHDYFSRAVLYVVIEGSFEISAGGIISEISGGSYAFCPALTNIFKRVLNTVTLIIINYDLFPCDKVITGNFDERSLETLKLLKTAMNAKDCQEYVRHLMRDLWYSITVELYGEPEKHTDRNTDSCFCEIVNYICANLDGNLTLSELSRRFGYSTSSLNTLFKKCSDMTPREFIISEKIKLAKPTLCETELPLRIIAKDCGWSNEYYFCAAFKKAIGMKPTEYRNMMKNR